MSGARSPYRLRSVIGPSFFNFQPPGGSNSVIPVPLNCWRVHFFLSTSDFFQGITFDGVDIDTLFVDAAQNPLSRLTIGGHKDAHGRFIYMNDYHDLVCLDGSKGLFGAFVQELIDTDSDPNNS